MGSPVRGNHVDGYAIAAGPSGVIYASGNFKGTVDFNVGGNNQSLTATGPYDLFVTKRDSAGSFVWAKQFRGTSWNWNKGLAVDSAENVYVTGNFQGTTDFDTGPGVTELTAIGGPGWPDAFVCKLDSDGELVWARAMGGSGNSGADSVAWDSDGNVYTTGYFSSTVDFDPGPGVYNLTAIGGFDIFVSKLDRFGNFVWTKQIGGTGSDRGTSLAIDSNGSACVLGHFEGTADFDPGSGVLKLTTATSRDYFVVKLDQVGALVWAKNFGGTASFGAFPTVTVAPNDNVCCFGRLVGTADYDPGPGTFNLTADGAGDVFVSKLDASGNLVWVRQLASNEHVDVGSIATDFEGGIYLASGFSGDLVFDPSGDNVQLTAVGYHDALVAKLNSDGTLNFASRMGGWIGWTSSVALDPAGEIYATGSFRWYIDFDPGPGTAYLSELGDNDDNDNTFILKLKGAHSAWVSSVNRAGPSPTSANSVNFDVTFDQPVTGVDASDFSLTTTGISGAAITSVSADAGATRTVTVSTGASDGSIRLYVLDDDTIAGADSAVLGGPGIGNGAFTGGQVYTIDKSAPTVAISSGVSDPTNLSPIGVTASFSEPVSGFSSGDITTSNGAVSGFSGSGATYTFNLTPQSQGAVSAQVLGGKCIDAVGNANTASPLFGRTYDSVSPSVTLSTSASSPTNANPIPITVTFNEPVSGFSGGDVAAINATVINFVGSGADYAFGLAPTGTGSVSANVAAGVAQDGATNPNTGSNVLTIYNDNVSPVITLAGSSLVLIEQFTAYSDAGATASDNFDGDLTSQIITSGSVDTSATGSYVLTYDVTDAAGNPATPAARLVIVTEAGAILPVNVWFAVLGFVLAGAATLALRARNTAQRG